MIISLSDNIKTLSLLHNNIKSLIEPLWSQFFILFLIINNIAGLDQEGPATGKTQIYIDTTTYNIDIHIKPCARCFVQIICYSKLY